MILRSVSSSDALHVEVCVKVQICSCQMNPVEERILWNLVGKKVLSLTETELLKTVW